MPELPEVETTLRGIAPHIENKCVSSVIIRQPKLRWPITPQLKKYLHQQTLRRITRRGKYLLFDFPSGTLLLHLGMSGRLAILPLSQPAKKHDHVDIQFASQSILRFTDPRRFGALLYIKDNPYLHPLLRSIGVEPLTESFTPEYLFELLNKRKTPIKSCLLDGQIVAGIGNIYATEALYLAGIDPRKIANQLTHAQLKTLVVVIKAVLENAILKGGTTLKDFMQSDGKPGYFRMELKAYGNANKPCPQCQRKFLSIRIAMRNTVYCQHCQK